MPVDAKAAPEAASVRDNWARTRKKKPLDPRGFRWAVLGSNQ
jgi:hypothetical protein